MNFCRYLPYVLTLESPAIITTLGGDPNSSSSLSCIPGSAVRGAMALLLGDPGTDDARRMRMFRELILDGSVRCLNAYPMSSSNHRALPMPASLRISKDATNQKEFQATDLAGYDGHAGPDMADEDDECWPQEQLSTIAKEFLAIGSARLVAVQPETNVRIHHQRDREKGRAWKDAQEHAHGAIFAFESLAGGQSFQGLIQVLARNEEEFQRIENEIKQLLPNDAAILVGRSRRAGYGGKARIAWRASLERELSGSGSEGLRPLRCDLDSGSQFRLLLTSACIVRDPDSGQIDPAGLEKIVCQAFGNRVDVVRRRWNFEIVGGFNRKWRLELPQSLAASAGSVLVLEASERIGAEELQRIENEGLGERKPEGFGRILVLEPPCRTISVFFSDERKQPSSPAGVPPPLAKLVEERLLRRQAARIIEELSVSFAGSAANLPSSSLLGRLRTPLRHKPDKALEILQQWLQGDDETLLLRRPAKEQLERCTIKMETFDGNLKEWLLAATKATELLKWLNAAAWLPCCCIASEQSARKWLEDNAKELSARLIDALLAALAIRNKTEEASHDAA